ncbi:MAG: 3-oxoadipyl-CoA thiolase [Pseudomonadota bacterium]|jgi:3-oxoadipyl-CoA thiolase
MTTRDAFLCAYVRTPIGRHGGALAPVRPDDLAARVVAGLLAGVPHLPSDAVEEVILGCTNQAGEDNRNVARMAALLAGLPPTVPGVTVNRLCASGLEAVVQAARAIRTGEAELVIAGGVESMSRAPFVLAKAEQAFARTAEIHDSTIGWRFVNPRMPGLHGTHSMPETAEAVAERFGIARSDQDAYALRSQQRTAAAQASGWLGGEILPVPVPQGRGEVAVDRDEHPRETTLEKLAALKLVVRPGGTVTAGNASGINDGAAALLLAGGDAVARYGLTPLARVVGAAAAGVEPRLMGIGPIPATEKLLARTGVSLGEIGRIELNEAFAAQVLAVTRHFGLADDDPRVNPAGGGIALGHPLGMTGARLAGTAARALAAGTAGRYALCTLCVGVGQGLSVLLEAV